PEIRLGLVEDLPLVGRILDADHRPVAGARVAVREVSDDASGRACLGPLPGQPPEVTTSADGRFRLTGVGRDRRVCLALDGPGIPHAEVFAATRPPSAEIPAGILGVPFDYVAGASRPVRGVVRDKTTGEPVAGVKVCATSGGASALTDREGLYELPRCPRSQGYEVLAQPQPGHPYFAAMSRLPDTPGSDPLTADFDLAGGIPLHGRVTDGATGKPPKRALVEYHPLY